jgi:hypothetical protein
MIGVTVFGLLFTPAFYVVVQLAGRLGGARRRGAGAIEVDG